MTITTVGYGDISATNLKEQIILIFLMTIGAAVWALVLGKLLQPDLGGLFDARTTICFGAEAWVFVQGGLALVLPHHNPTPHPR